ncbi:hypothetical protein GCM10022267_91400 [Lentzea roselyniae]|uniref:Galactose oxidase-like Early set domain-containing protein n=2 Tax=Lentzea roselyniae TaxID=531940 RepID=A0ABP7CMS2_9PSEU
MLSPAEVGEWSAPFWEGDARNPAVPLDPPSLEKGREFPSAAHIALLPSGKVLYWNGLEGTEDAVPLNAATYPQFAKNARARVLDLNGPTWSVPTPERGYEPPPGDPDGHLSRHNLFCADQKLLHDGTVLIAGGESRPGDTMGIRETRVFTPEGAAGTFANVGDMVKPRWYPSLITLPDGKVLVLTGTTQMFTPDAEQHVHGSYTSYNNVREQEVYDLTTRRWEQKKTPMLSLPLYARVHLMPNGKVFYPAAGNGWGGAGQTPDEALWTEQRLYDPQTDSWQVAGTGQYGFREPTSALLRLEPPYQQAKVLLAGGTVMPMPTPPTANTLSEVVTVTGDTVSNDGQRKGPLDGKLGDQSQLRNPRWASSPTVLPTGEVILFSGADTEESLLPGTEKAVRTAELYDPATNTWRNLAAGSRDRTYHNVALLLPDGRVLVGGHTPVRVFDGSPAPSNSYRDASFEIYSPPYLFRGPRPQIKQFGVSATGHQLDIKVAGSSSEISGVVAVRFGSSTHSVDADQRAVSLPFEPIADGVLKARLPSQAGTGLTDGNILPPGPYHIFVLRNTPDGPVPSIARTVFTKPAGDGRVTFALAP